MKTNHLLTFASYFSRRFSQLLIILFSLFLFLQINNYFNKIYFQILFPFVNFSGFCHSECMQFDNNFNSTTPINFIQNSCTIVNLSEELLKHSLDNPRIYPQINQNETHLFRAYVRYITKTKYIFIIPAEYEHLLKLKENHGLKIKLDKSFWHWGTLVNGGWVVSYISLYETT
uniref:Uncharacterized protein n=1 Tax=Oxytricha trifallax TaxID=1172189 RepID=G9HRA7_9SPIT|nr:hypothetical protein [Oxytricha trifallax]